MRGSKSNLQQRVSLHDVLDVSKASIQVRLPEAKLFVLMDKRPRRQHGGRSLLGSMTRRKVEQDKGNQYRRNLTPTCILRAGIAAAWSLLSIAAAIEYLLNFKELNVAIRGSTTQLGYKAGSAKSVRSTSSEESISGRRKREEGEFKLIVRLCVLTSCLAPENHPVGD